MAFRENQEYTPTGLRYSDPMLNVNVLSETGRIQIAKLERKIYLAQAQSEHKAQTEWIEEAKQKAEVYYSNKPQSRKEFIVPTDGGRWNSVRPSSRIRQ